MNLILSESRVIRLHPRRLQYSLIFIQIFVVGHERRTCFETLETQCVMALQDHPRSLILAPIKSTYATSYWSSTVILILSFPVSETQGQDQGLDVQGQGLDLQGQVQGHGFQGHAQIVDLQGQGQRSTPSLFTNVSHPEASTNKSVSTELYKSVVEVTISTYIHNSDPVNIKSKAHKAKRIKTKGFASKAKDLTSKAKAKDCNGQVGM